MFWTAVGWILWAVVAFIVLRLWLLRLTDSDCGVRISAGRSAVLLSIALVVTALTGVHQLNLLWAAPILLWLPMVVTVAQETARGVSPFPFPLSEEKAVDIVAEFDVAFAMCKEEWLLFKPQSLLAYDLDTVDRALKLAYQSGYPLPDELEWTSRLSFLQISFFIPDDHFDRASAYFERSVGPLKKVWPKQASLDYRRAICTVNGGPNAANDPDEFFEREFLVDAPPNSDKKWVQQLTRNCWQHFRRRFDEWEEFVALVETGKSGLEPRELALAET